MLRQIYAFFRRKLRSFYESEISLPHGVLQFFANFAFIQLTTDEYVDLSPCSKHTGDIRITSKDGRPKLTYKYWPPNFEYKEDMPVLSLIIEERRLILKDGDKEWDAVDIDDPRVVPLHGIFHACSFHWPMRAEHKRKLEDLNAKAAQ